MTARTTLIVLGNARSHSTVVLENVLRKNGTHPRRSAFVSTVRSMFECENTPYTALTPAPRVDLRVANGYARHTIPPQNKSPASTPAPVPIHIPYIPPPKPSPMTPPTPPPILSLAPALPPLPPSPPVLPLPLQQQSKTSSPPPFPAPPPSSPTLSTFLGAQTTLD
eukprot:6196724-Pleurochrysis_carterae.AAC.2